MALAAGVPRGKGVTSAAATGSGGTVVYYVDITEVERLFDAFDEAISGPSLMRWLSTAGSEFFARDIESRFEEEGDAKSGFWKELSPTTVRIRESMGVGGPGPINVRTGELKSFVKDSRDFSGGPNWAGMDVPGESSNARLMKKLHTAQYGTTDNPTFPGRKTDPRKVLAVSEMDAMTLLELLSNYIVREAMFRVQG